ncbi:glycosyl transferase, group 1 [Stanieria sp. NIES-3757]|nr:glycosyl transferase, group 1 [Stanieria sp. NIES-3757]
MTFPAQDRKLKISLVVSDLSSSGAGRWGGAIRPFLIAQALRQLDYEVEMLGIAFGEESPAIANSGFPVISFPCQYHSGFFQAASKLINQINGNIIYAVKLKPSSFGLALIKKFFTGRPLILDIDDWELSWHGGDKLKYDFNPKQIARDFLQPKGQLKHPDHPLYLKWVEKLANRADVITIHNRFLQKRFGGIYLPNGKDTSLFNPDHYEPEVSRVKYGLSNYTILMFPGAPRPYKGVEDVLIALDKLNRSDLRLVIVGGSPYDDYDLQLQKKWGKWIIQLPKSPVASMPEIIAAAHIIVVPQRDSPATQAQFPLKLTDGMAMAKPILASCVGDIPQILGETGYLVEPNSPEQIATTLELILDDFSTANTKGIAARKRCIKHYSISAMAEILKPILAKFSII